MRGAKICTILIFLSTILISLCTFAQSSTSEDYRFSIQISAGSSFPLGSFSNSGPGQTLTNTLLLPPGTSVGSQDLQHRKDEAGFAVLGYQAEVRLSYHYDPAITLSAFGAYSHYGVDLDQMQDFWNDRYTGRTSVPSYVHDPYNIYGLGLGGTYRVPVGAMTFRFGLDAGLAYTQLPYWRVEILRADGFYTFWGPVQPDLRSPAPLEQFPRVFAPLFGGSISLSRDFGRFSASFTTQLRYASFKFDAANSAYPGSSVILEPYEDRLKVTSLNIMLGLSYALK